MEMPSLEQPMHRDGKRISDRENIGQFSGKALQELPSVRDTWMVGDTEADIIAAKTHHLKVIGVLSGIRDREQLLKYEPDYIVANLTEAVEVITAVVPAMT